MRINSRRALYRNEPMQKKSGAPQEKIAVSHLSYAQAISMATLNCRGLMEISKYEELMQIMQIHHIDILALQETKVSSSSEEQKIQ